MLDSLWQGTTLKPRGQMKNVPACFASPTSDKSEEAAPPGMVVSGKGSCHIPVSGAPECPGEKGRWCLRATLVQNCLGVIVLGGNSVLVFNCSA